MTRARWVERSEGEVLVVSLDRLMPTLPLGARLTCATAATTTTTTLLAPNARSSTVRALLDTRRPAVEVVISWGTESADVDLGTLDIRNRAGTVIADLDGRRRIGKSRRTRARLSPSIVEGRTFDIVTMQVPRRGRTMALTVTAPVLLGPTDVTVQVRPVRTTAAPGVTGVPSAPGAPNATSPPPSGPAAPQPSSTPSPPPPPVRVTAYGNYGAATAGHAMCRGNPSRSDSMPGGTATQTFTVPSGVASIDTALVQIDPDSRVSAHANVLVNGVVRATARAAAAGDTTFSFLPVAVRAGDAAALSISFSATFGKIITVYSAAAVGGTFTTSNGCPGASNVSIPNGLRADITGWSG